MQYRADAGTFLRYVLPAMTSQLLMGCFIIVDGFFIGRCLGDTGLAAINLLWPISAVILATGLGIGTGGSVLFSAARGAGDAVRAGKARTASLLLLAAATLCLACVLWVSYPALLRAFGATGELYAPAREYCRVVIPLCGMQIFNGGLNPLLRAHGRTVQAMSATVAGLVCNIFLDWLFILRFSWGMAGAAAATVAAQFLSAVLAAVFLAAQKSLPFARGSFRRIAPRTFARILHIGISPFGLSMSASILIMFYNWQSLAWGGTPGVAAYAVVSYALGAAQPLLTGVAEGVQPLMSFFRGAGNRSAEQTLMRMARRMVLAVGAGLCCIMILSRGILPAAFGASETVFDLCQSALPLSALSLIPWGAVHLYASYYYAVTEVRLANLLIYGEPLVLTPALLFLLPLFCGLNGVWASLGLAECLLLIFIFFAEKRRKFTNT